MTLAKRFTALGLTPLHAERLLQAASMIADGDTEIEKTILSGTEKNIAKLMKKCDGSEEALEVIVDKAEMLMPDLAFGNPDDVIEEAMDIAASEEKGSLASIMHEEMSDTFLDGEYESLDAIGEQELSEPSYEQFQEEWN